MTWGSTTYEDGPKLLPAIAFLNILPVTFVLWVLYKVRDEAPLRLPKGGVRFCSQGDAAEAQGQRCDQAPLNQTRGQ